MRAKPLTKVFLTSSHRVVDVDHVCLPGPGVRVECASGLSVLLDDADGSVDLKQAEHGGAAGAALEPDHHGGIGRVDFLNIRNTSDDCYESLSFYPNPEYLIWIGYLRLAYSLTLLMNGL